MSNSLTAIATIAVPTASAPLPLWHAVLLFAPAVIALGASFATQRGPTIASSWMRARTATVLMMAVAAANTVVLIATESSANTLVRTDTVGVAMGLLVSFIAWVIVRYSQAYLAGDPKERSYTGRLLLTIAMVQVVVVANHLVLLVLAWTATSVALHRLLTFYADRPVAIAVAHKKFLLARAADFCMVGAIIAFGTSLSTVRIDQMVAEVSSLTSLPTGARVSILLVAIAVLLKCAQLPFHGWLIQVMEAPTPVSALLHAGVVNLGGFVLLRFAPIVDRAVETRVLLVAVGTATAVLAAMVMTTRISVKVSLAWSTCAQMGFMVMQCGLGLWEMALLHLLAHSLYKAHAFLGAGGVVRQAQWKQLVLEPARPRAATIGLGLVATTAATAVAGVAVGLLPFADRPTAALWVVGGIVAAALVPLAVRPERPQHAVIDPRGVASAGLLALVYFSLHAVFGELVPHGSTPPIALIVGVALAFGALFVVQTLSAVTPSAAWSRRLYPWFYGGLFLDEAFTRMAFRIWAPPAPRPEPSLLPQRTSVAAVVLPSGRISPLATTLAHPTSSASHAAPLSQPLFDGSIA